MNAWPMAKLKSESAPYGNERLLPVVYKTKTTKHNNVYAWLKAAE